jgi:predicted transcriptional regulator
MSAIRAATAAVLFWLSALLAATALLVAPRPRRTHLGKGVPTIHIGRF